MNYRYIKGPENSRETVEFETAGGMRNLVTTCVVNVDLLMCGINCFPCGSGDDITLTTKQRLEILNFVEAERGKIIHKAGPKSMEDWHNSGLNSFDEFFLPGDTVTEDVYDYYLDLLPPATMRRGLLQVGEPAEHIEDPETGKWRATYATFANVNGEWYYAGECFRGETVNRRSHPGRLAQKIIETERQLKREEKNK